MKYFLLAIVALLNGCIGFTFAQTPIQAGIAKVAITPVEPIWMAGYASRTKPAEGKAHDLWAKAVALDDGTGTTLIVLTTDLIGFPRSISEATVAKVMAKTGLKREHLMLTSSHTHTGPVLRDNLADMYNLPPNEAAKLKVYSDNLVVQLADVMIKAWESRVPAKLSIGEGNATFAQNRRQETKTGVAIGYNAGGPVDHRVPVLKIENAAGDKTLGIVFGYACHNTTLDYYQWCGDYAGFAQAELETAWPGAVAMFWMGCGADANPYPRRTEELARRHGKSLAEAVTHALRAGTVPLSGPFAAKYSTVSLALEAQPTREQLQADMLNKTFAIKTRATRLMKQLDATGKLDSDYPYYPVQVWRLGPTLVWVALGGEVVVDYAHRLRKDIPTGNLWVTGYANDVMAYIPSARVLKEGGYEADSSMIYYGMPGRWKPILEEQIITETKKHWHSLTPAK